MKPTRGPHRYLSALLAFVSLIVISSVAVAQVDVGPDLITNGSFETPNMPVGGFTNFSTGSTAIPGWTVVGPGPGVSVVSGSFVTGCCKFPASNGSQWLDLTGVAANQVEGVEQTVATVPGDLYHATFALGGVLGNTSNWHFLINGRDLGGILGFSCPPPVQGNQYVCTNTLAWPGNYSYSLFFPATASSTTIEFLAEGLQVNPNSGGLASVSGLDNVVVRREVFPAEPATLGLLGLGLVGAGLFRRRR